MDPLSDTIFQSHFFRQNTINLNVLNYAKYKAIKLKGTPLISKKSTSFVFLYVDETGCFQAQAKVKVVNSGHD